jgi:hypothetical protein
VEVIGADEVRETVTINEPAIQNINEPIIDQQTGEQVIVNDLSKGKYSVVSKSGPAFSTRRQETVRQLVELAGGSPVIQELGLDLIIDNMELNKGDELKGRVRKNMISKGLIEATEEEKKELGLDQPQPPDPMNEELIKNLQAQTEQTQVKTQEVMAKVDNMEAQTQKVILESNSETISSMKDLMAAFLENVQAGIQITPEQQNLLDQQTVIVDEVQDNVIAGGEVADSAPAQAAVNMEQPPVAPPQEESPIQGEVIPSVIE